MNDHRSCYGRTGDGGGRTGRREGGRTGETEGSAKVRSSETRSEDLESVGTRGVGMANGSDGTRSETRQMRRKRNEWVGILLVVFLFVKVKEINNGDRGRCWLEKQRLSLSGGGGIRERGGTVMKRRERKGWREKKKRVEREIIKMRFKAEATDGRMMRGKSAFGGGENIHNSYCFGRRVGGDVD